MVHNFQLLFSSKYFHSVVIVKFRFLLFLALLGPRSCAGSSLAAASGGYALVAGAGFSLWWLLVSGSMYSASAIFVGLSL